MTRVWDRFDEETLSGEFRSLPTKDFYTLTFAMANYREGTGIHYRVQSYGSGIWMITDAGRGQGRCLYFAEVEELDTMGGRVQRLVALRVYKKESAKAPRSEIELAQRRLAEYKRNRGKQ